MAIISTTPNFFYFMDTLYNTFPLRLITPNVCPGLLE